MHWGSGKTKQNKNLTKRFNHLEKFRILLWRLMMTRITPANLVIENVTVITMDPTQPTASGVAIADGKFIGLIFNNNEKWPLSPHGQRIDGEGLTLMPGLIDAHCHLRAQISRYISISCDRENVSNIHDIISLLRDQASKTPTGTWIRATNYDPFHLKERRHPTRWDLDRATTDHPIRLRHVTRHVSVLNSTALSLAGIGPNDPDPPGVTVEREPGTNIPTGLIYGGDSWLSKYVIPPISPNELHAGAHHLKEQLLRMGITAVQDATPTNSSFDVEFWYSRIKNNWPITILLMADHERHDNIAYTIKREVPKHEQNKLQLGPIKVVMESHPQLYPDIDTLIKIAVTASSKKIPIAVHAVNPEMIWAALEAFKHSIMNVPSSNIRHRIEHLSLCPNVFLDDISKSRAIVVTNPSFIYEHGERYLLNVDKAEHPSLYRLNSLYTSGIPVAAGSDAPVASINPWVGIVAACNRETSLGKKIAKHEKLNRWQALELYTSGAAFAAGWKNCGIIKPGKKADFIILNKNPLTCSLDELRQIKVFETWIDGKLTYRSNQI